MKRFVRAADVGLLACALSLCDASGLCCVLSFNVSPASEVEDAAMVEAGRFRTAFQINERRGVNMLGDDEVCESSRRFVRRDKFDGATSCIKISVQWAHPRRPLSPVYYCFPYSRVFD